MNLNLDLISAGRYGAVTKDVTFAQPTLAVWCTVAGDIAFIGAHQHDIQILPDVPAFTWVELNAKQIVTTGTDATIGMALFRREQGK